MKIIRLLGRALAVCAMLLVFPMTAFAAITINSVTVTPDPQLAGGQVSVTVNATTSGPAGDNNDWDSTQIVLTKSGESDITLYCGNSPDVFFGTTSNIAFPGLTVPANAAPGLWTVRVRVFQENNDCNTSNQLDEDTSETLTVTGLEFCGDFRSKSSRQSNDDDSFSVTKPAGTVQGDLMIATMVFDDGGDTLSAPAGWTLIEPASPGGEEMRTRSWYRVAGAIEPASYTFSSSGGGDDMIVQIATFYNPGSGWTLEDHSYKYQNSFSDTITTNSVNTVVDGLLYTAFGNDDNESVDIAPSGMSELYEQETDSVSLASYYQLTGAAAAVTKSLNWGGSADQYSAIAAVFSCDIPVPVCGDNVTEAPEECDDGNTSDGDGCSATCTLESANTAPVAEDDAFTVDEDFPLNGDVNDDNGNGADHDDDGDPLTTHLDTDVSNGGLALNADGTFLYVPNPNYCGADSFTYHVNDGEDDSNVATVSITITCVDDWPEAVPDYPTVNEDDPATTIDVLANDTDIDGGPKSIFLATDPTNGTVVITNAGADLTYQPDADYCNDGSPTDDFIYVLTPGGNSATVYVTVNCVNDEPDFTVVDPSVGEDTGPHTGVAVTSGFVPGPANESGQTVIACNLSNFNDPNTPTVITSAPVASVNGSSDGCVISFDTTLNNYGGSITFDLQLQDSGGTSNGGDDVSPVRQVTITVNPVNDPPYIESITADQTVQYSDDIDTITVLVRDIDSVYTDLGLTRSGQPSAIGDVVMTNPCQAWDSGYTGTGGECTWTLDGQVLVPGDQDIDIVFTPSDAGGDGNTGTHTLSVVPEDATVVLDDGNDVAVLADENGNIDPVVMYFTAWETNDVDVPFPMLAAPDLPLATANANQDEDDFVTDAPFEVKGFMSLNPVGPGGGANVECVEFASGGTRPYGEFLTFECTFPAEALGVNVYEVEASVDGDPGNRYFAGADEDALVVYDPSLGFTTAGGWFYWPDTAIEEGPCAGYPGDKTNFGYVMKYNRKGLKVQGSLLFMRHTVEALDGYCLEAGNYKVKSNALYGLALGEGTVPENFGWASFAGKATYKEPNMDTEGNHLFFIYAEDHGEQGCNQDPSDRIWVEVWDKDDVVVMTLGADAQDDAVDIECGNIYAPHTPANP